MALEATHIRFALDLKDTFRVKNIQHYIVGTIYPDSRYMSGISRELTHPINYLDRHWEDGDDFEKGWLVHLLVDKVQWKITKEKMPYVFEGKTGQGSEVWIKHTAIKILQDIDDVKKFDIRSYLPLLDYIQNPNGEDQGKMRKYNHIFQKMYANPEQVDIERCYKMWKELGIDDDLAMKLKIQAEHYSGEGKVMDMVEEIYPNVLGRLLQ